MLFKEQLKIVSISYVAGVLLNLAIEAFAQKLTALSGFWGSIKITSLLTVWWLFYFRFGWKLPVFSRILFKMNFNGTWFGHYESVTSKNEKFAGDIALRIQQNYLTISLISFSENHQHFSYTELVKFDEKSGTHEINYSYFQQENILLDTSKRNGTSELALKYIKGEPWLEGIFWTLHGSKGNIKVRRISTTQIDTFGEAKKTAKAKTK